MLNKDILKHFTLGFLSVFRFGAIPIKKQEFWDKTEYFNKIENDINKSYEELKSHEGN